MNTREHLSFGELLRRYRLAAGLTQEELAERAGLSARGITALETGERLSPRRDTVQLLADALELTEPERTTLGLAARRTPSPATGPTQPHTRRSNLPLQPTPFIGRERELAAVRQRLLQPEVRLLTLTGTGGTGKTRLALQVAGQLQDDFADGVFFVSLGTLTDPSLVASAVAQVLGLEERASQPLIERLKAHLRERQLLLVLDNFEQLLPAGPLLTELLAACPALKLLVTSRAVLRVYGEHAFPVQPLEVPDSTRQDLESLAQSEAVRLFVERAQAVQPDFALTEENIAVVAEVCRRLEGLPLAIELAAARSNLLSPQAMLARLDSRLNLLTGGARDLQARQQTLRGTIDWSYNLLTPDEQTLFARLGIFVNGTTLEAAAAVCNAAGDLQGDLIDLFASLVDKSLLRQQGARNQATASGEPAEPRFVMLETLREYALERLAAQGELEILRQRHAYHFLQLVEAAAPKLGRGAHQVAWYHRVAAEHDNLRAAFQWAQEHQDVELGLRLGASLWQFWMTRGYLSEGRRWLETFLAMSKHDAQSPHGTSIPKAVHLRALRGAGWLASEQNDYEHATTFFERGLVCARELGDTKRVARILADLAYTLSLQGDYRRAEPLSTESAELARELRDERTLAFSLNALGIIAHAAGDTTRARSFLEEALALAQARNDRVSVAWTLVWLGRVAKGQGEYDRAATLFGDSLALFRDLQNRDGIAFTLEFFAGYAATHGQVVHAARLFGAAEALREEIGSPLTPFDRPAYERDVARARAQMDEASWTAAWAEGRAMPLEQAVAEAEDMRREVQETAAASTPRRQIPTASTPATEHTVRLTPRERQVIALIARGYSNRAIAEALVITERTAEIHVGNILGKLDFTSRAQAAAYAVAHGLADPPDA